MVSIILDAQLGSVLELLLSKTTKNLNTNQKKWHSAFVRIYCSRAILSLNNKTTPKKIPRSLSYTTIDLMKPNHSFGLDQTDLIELVKDKNLSHLQELGGPVGVSTSLGSHPEHGVRSDDEDIARRKEAFGSNTYRKPPAKSFFYFVWQAFQDLTIVILLFCAALSLGFGMKVHGAKEGWIDGLSIFVAVFLVIGVSSVSNYRYVICSGWVELNF